VRVADVVPRNGADHRHERRSFRAVDRGEHAEGRLARRVMDSRTTATAPLRRQSSPRMMARCRRWCSRRCRWGGRLRRACSSMPRHRPEPTRFVYAPGIVSHFRRLTGQRNIEHGQSVSCGAKSCDRSTGDRPLYRIFRVRFLCPIFGMFRRFCELGSCA
jgi:hypothetical protein